jgi:hypothetical protein
MNDTERSERTDGRPKLLSQEDKERSAEIRTLHDSVSSWWMLLIGVECAKWKNRDSRLFSATENIIILKTFSAVIQRWFIAVGTAGRSWGPYM